MQIRAKIANGNILLSLLFITIFLLTTSTVKAEEVNTSSKEEHCSFYRVFLNWAPEKIIILKNLDFDNEIFRNLANQEIKNNITFSIDCIADEDNKACNPLQQLKENDFDRNKISEETWNKLISKFHFSEERAKISWSIGGVCSGLTQEEFFREVYKIGTKIIEDKADLNDYIGKSMLLEEWQELFGGSDKVNLMCEYDLDDEKYYFSQLVLFWDKELKHQINKDIEHLEALKISNCPKSELIYLREPKKVESK
ncbi:MAG: hypothetical protein HRU35_00650 [Rickettsiaceae bacterium]|nr:hypothetical protein [Rickettsiaceae bacterium]